MAVVSILAALAGPAQGDGAPVDQWSGVGVLHIGGVGRCSGALIAPDVVLTAAHCVSETSGREKAAPGEITFFAGVRDNRSVARRRAISVQVHPGYHVSGSRFGPETVRVDVARVRLESAIDAPVYRIAAAPSAGAEVALVSYGRGRWSNVEVQGPCRMLSREREFATFDCQNVPGSSGAPIFRMGPGTPTIVALNSGRRVRAGGASRALGLTLDHLVSWLSSDGGAAAPRPAPAPRLGAGASAPGRAVSRPGGGLSGLGVGARRAPTD